MITIPDTLSYLTFIISEEHLNKKLHKKTSTESLVFDGGTQIDPGF